jgi:hypothetical protein
MAALCCAASPAAFRSNDVVAFVGGADVAAAQHSGHLESLLAIQHRGMNVRFRNFGWEGDTVFEQPRDFAFPAIPSNMEKAGVTVVVLQFGRAEALSGKKSVTDFRDAYAKLLDQFTPKFRTLILVTPVPFDKAHAPLPDLSRRNIDVSNRRDVILALGRERNLKVVDLFAALTETSGIRLTSDGLQLTAEGHAAVAKVFANQMGLTEPPTGSWDHKENGEWKDARYEAVRQAVIAKNRLWFDYSRPQNWAFLGGDRTTQPSSRDHRDPKLRWFPAEMEKFVPLIRDAEKRIDELAHAAASP